MGPQAFSLIVADDIRREDNGKLIVIGLYTHVSLEEPPDEENPPGIKVMANVAGLSAGSHDFEIEVIDVDGEQKIASGPESVVSESANNVHKVILDMVDFYFPTSGRYLFNLLVNGEKIAEHVAIVHFPQSKSGESTSGAEEDSLPDPISKP